MSKKTAVFPLGEPSEDSIKSDKEDATQKAEKLREVRKQYGAKSEEYQAAIKQPSLPEETKQASTNHNQQDADADAKDDTLDDENDQSSSTQHARMERRANAKSIRFCRTFVFVVLLSFSVWGFSFFQLLVTREEDLTIIVSTQHNINVRMESCDLHVFAADVDQVETIRIRSSLVSLPFVSQATLTAKTNTESQETTIVSELHVSRNFAAFSPCAINMYIESTANIDNVHLNIVSTGSNPSSITFHNQSIPLLGSFHAEGPVLYIGSTLAHAPAYRMNVNINSGLVNISSINYATSMNITTTSADVYLLSSTDVLKIEKLLQPYQHFIIIGACFDTIGCYKGLVEEQNNTASSILNYTDLQQLTVYPNYEIEQQPISNQSFIHLSLKSITGSIYCGSIDHVLLHERKFTMASGKMHPEFELSSLDALHRVNQFINTAPDEDAIVIMDIHGPNIEIKKWIYATREPYLQIEPAWLWILSLGVLNARQQHLQIHVSVGHWPFRDSRRDLGIANETVLPVISSYAFDAYGQNIDGITYQLFDRLKISMNVPLLADVLSFKTENALYKFISQGPSSFFAEPISWQTNGFLAPAIFLSIVTAVCGSIIITVLLFKEGSQFMKTYIKKSNLKSIIGKLKKSLAGKAKNQLLKKTTTTSNDSTTNSNTDEKDRQKELVEKLQNYVLDGRKKIKSMKSGLFNTEVPKEDRALVAFSMSSTDNFAMPKKELMDTTGDGNLDSIGVDTTGDGEIDTYSRIDSEDEEQLEENTQTTTCTCSLLTQCKRYLSEKNCICRSARNVKSCCYSCCCKKKQDDFPSPFILPTLFFGEFYSNSSNSLKDFIKSPHTYELDEKSKWTTNGRTTIERFDEIYSDWCDKNDRRKISVLENENTLKSLGIQVGNELEQCISKCTWKTYQQRRKNVSGLETFATVLKKCQEIEETTKNGSNSEVNAMFSIGELAFKHFKEQRLEITGDVNDFLTFDDIHQKFESFWDENLNESVNSFCTKIPGTRPTKRKSFVKHLDEMKINKLARRPLLLPLYFARDSESFGLDALCRRDIYVLGPGEVENEWTFSIPSGTIKNAIIKPGSKVTQGSVTGFLKKKLTKESTEVVLTASIGDTFVATADLMIGTNDSVTQVLQSSIGDIEVTTMKSTHSSTLGKLSYSKTSTAMGGVEVLTLKELRERQKKDLVKFCCLNLSKQNCFAKKYDGVSWYFIAIRESFIYIGGSALLCLVIPLPLCLLVLYHQVLYRKTTAVTNQFSPEILVTHPLNFQDNNVKYWLKHWMPLENQIILLTSLPYYLLSIVKLLMFYLNVKGSLRRFIRKLWLGYSCFFVFLMIGWIIIILQWILLGAVLNPVAVLAYSVAVGSSVGYLLKMWISGIKKMKSIRLKLKEIVEKRLLVVMNKKSGVLVKMQREADQVKRKLQREADQGKRKLQTTIKAIKSRREKLPMINIAQAFEMSDVDGNKVLDFGEFQILLENMNIKLSYSRALKIFASSDRGGSNTITYNEFVVCWEKLKWLITEDALINTGLSRRNILLGLLYAAIFLTVLFSFLFLSVSAFGGAGTFGATVRSFLALSASKLGTLGEAGNRDLTFITKAAEKSLNIFLGTSAGGMNNKTEPINNESSDEDEEDDDNSDSVNIEEDKKNQ